MKSIINSLEEYANNLGLRPQKATDSSIQIWASLFTGISLKLEIKESKLFQFDYYCRTSSHQYNGERTDLHDIIPIIFAAYLKKSNICSAGFIDIPNPATGSDVEIYARFIVPVQINPELIIIDALNTEKAKELIFSLFSFEKFFWSRFDGCPCEECRSKLKLKYEYRWEEIHPNRIKKITAFLGESSDINYCERTLPTWFYYRDFSQNISFVKAKELTNFVNALLPKLQIIPGIYGELQVDETFKNYLNYKTKTKIENYFSKLRERKPKFILFEDKILALGKEYMLIADERCGFNEYKLEKEKIRKRHKKEFDVLFKPSNLIWSDKIDDSLFEEMIKDLLEKESYVLRVRKTSNTRERDGGADLIAEFNVQKEKHEITSEKDSLYKKIKVVVQCKAYKNGVSKSDVLDIRDTIDYRSYDGYFLAISSYTKKSLSDYLDKLRITGKIWIDWWTKSEIEDKIKQHEDLLIKYNSIIKLKSESLI